MASEVYINPLLYFAAVLDIDDRKPGWRQAKEHTLQYRSLFMLEHIFKDQPEAPEHVEVEIVEDCFDSESCLNFSVPLKACSLSPPR